MSRYTPPSDPDEIRTGYRHRPAWVRFGVWACVFAVALLALGTMLSFFV